MGKLFPRHEKLTKNPVETTGNRYKIVILMGQTQKLKGLAAASLILKTINDKTCLRMKRIKLEFFRCYAQFSIEFKPGINLLIGDNASGKTSVLAACKYVLSSFFSGFSTENTKWISPMSDDFMQIESNGIISDEQPLKIHFDIDRDILPSLQEENRANNFNLSSEQTIQKNSWKNSRALVTGIRDYKNYCAILRNSFSSYDMTTKAEIQRMPLPLFASFSTEDIHTSRKIKSSPFLKYAQKRSFGYYECLEGNGLFRFWQKRLLVLTEGRELADEISIVRNAIIDALGPEGCNIICNMDIRPIQGCIYYKYIDGREVESDLLSDGYKRLVNIVTDIAERCAILNRPFWGLEAAKKTKGTVLIDEIDMHLHPSLQARVLTGLKKAFPEIQFIASTHAPMVMAGVKNTLENIVYMLAYSKEEKRHIAYAVQPYGMDLSSISRNILNICPRPEEVESNLESLFELIDNGDYDDAKILLSKMKRSFGNNISELSEAETLINLNLLDDETDSQRQ